MPISIVITPQDIKFLRKELRKEQNFVCLDQNVFIKANLVGLRYPAEVKAQIIKGYKDQE